MSIEGAKLNSFSIVVPSCERPNLTIRCINTLLDQAYDGDFEIILVEDGSRDEVKQKLDNYVESINDDSKLRIIHHEKRMQRLVARNTGIKNATKEWITHVDSDDQLIRCALDNYNWAINEYPEYEVFNYGAIVHRLKRHELRHPIEFKDDESGQYVTEKFKSGLIGMGSFFYKRSLHDEVGLYPEVGSPYKFSDWAKDEFPECLEWYGPKYLDGGKEMGNPWGDDWLLFYLLTRNHKSKCLPLYTYHQFVRRSDLCGHDDDRILNRNNIAIA